MLQRIVSALDFGSVRSLYDERVAIHQEIREDFKNQRVDEYVQTALGIANRYGNFSASEWGLGPRILESSTPRRVFDLAEWLFDYDDPIGVPDVIYAADIPYLKISVGSEMAMMLRPEDCWVTNGPTLYAYFLVENNGNTATANEVLSLYESNYDMWRDLHPDIGPSLRRLGQMGSDVSSNQSIAPGSVTYLWADAISDGLYTTLVRRNAA